MRWSSFVSVAAAATKKNTSKNEGKIIMRKVEGFDWLFKRNEGKFSII